MIKKFNISLIVTILLMSSVSSNLFAANNMNNADFLGSTDSVYEYNIIENSSTNSKIELINTNNGDKEYVESINTDEGYIHRVSSKEGNYEITRKDGNIIIKNIDKNKSETIEFNDNSEDNLFNHNLNYDDGFSANSVTFPTPWNDIAVGATGYSSVAIQYANAGVVASILASIFGGAVTGVIVSIASYYVSINAPHAYYQYRHQIRMTGTRCWERRTIKTWWEYHDYTGYVGTEFTPPRRGCG